MTIILDMVLPLLCGLALFLVGMDLMGDSLKKSAGSGLKTILGKMTSSPVKGFLLGLGVTMIIQSSSATTVMVVGFVNSGITTLKQAVGVIMGSNIGTTLTAWLLSLVPDIQRFLSERLGLSLHMGKLTVTDIKHGVEFLGAFVKPYRTYASNDCLRRMERNIRNISTKDDDAVYRSVNSFLGVLCHHKTYRIRRRMFLREKFLKISTFNRDMTLFGKPQTA